MDAWSAANSRNLGRWFGKIPGQELLDPDLFQSAVQRRTEAGRLVMTRGVVGIDLGLHRHAARVWTHCWTSNRPSRRATAARPGLLTSTGPPCLRRSGSAPFANPRGVVAVDNLS